MATKKTKAKPIIISEMQNSLNQGFTEKQLIVRNGISESLLGFNLPGVPGMTGTMVNQVNTLFKNMRWYFISTDRILISEAYVEHGVMATVVDVPVNDAFRGGIDIHSGQLSEDELKLLKHTVEVNADMEKVAQASKWTRLFGGGALMAQLPMDPRKELVIKDLKQGFDLNLKALDMWEIFSNEPSPYQKEQTILEQTDMTTAQQFNYYGLLVDRSKFRIMKGIEAPSLLRVRLRGWGMSVYERLVNAVNQYLKSNDVLFQLLDEYKVDVYKIKNLSSQLLTAAGANAFKERMMSVNQVKNYNNAMCLDSEDDFIQKQIVLSGIQETADGIRIGIASALRMPLSKVFGIPATGFSSGEDDLENYNGMVESEVRTPAKPDILWVLQLRCQQLFGDVPTDLEAHFKPLRMLSAEQEENVKTQKHARLLSTAQAGFMSTEEFKEACNKGNLFDIKLDPSLDRLEPIEGEKSESAPAGTKSTLEAKT